MTTKVTDGVDMEPKMAEQIEGIGWKVPGQLGRGDPGVMKRPGQR